MDSNDAVQLAREDAEHILTLRGERWRAGDLLVDGTAYSPSWRALPGGARVHDEGDDLGDAAEAYQEELDSLTEDVGWWSDGCFWANEGDLSAPVGSWRNDA